MTDLPQPTDLPQLWELSALMQLEQRAEEAEQLRTAILMEAGSVRLADRLRGATGGQIEVGTVAGVRVAGALQLVASDAAVVAADPDCWLIPLSAVAAATLPEMPGVIPARGLERVGCTALLRRLVDRTVTVVVAGRSEICGPLAAVGADHLSVQAIRGVTCIPLSGLVAVRWRADRDSAPAPP